MPVFSGFILLTCLNIKSCNLPDIGLEKLKGNHNLSYPENLLDWNFHEVCIMFVHIHCCW